MSHTLSSWRQRADLVGRRGRVADRKGYQFGGARVHDDLGVESSAPLCSHRRAAAFAPRPLWSVRNRESRLGGSLEPLKGYQPFGYPCQEGNKFLDNLWSPKPWSGACVGGAGPPAGGHPVVGSVSLRVAERSLRFPSRDRTK